MKKYSKLISVIFALIVNIITVCLSGCSFISKSKKAEIDTVLDKANYLAAQYDYESACQLLESYNKPENKQLSKAIEKFEIEKSKLKQYEPISETPHIFFHSIIMDNSLAFDGDEDSMGYGQWMITVTEFKRILEELYKNNYVLISMHDLAVETENGFESGKIYLPEGKHPIIISQDDVNYYKYMEGDGFASRLVLDVNGGLTCEYIKPDGTKVTGAYDLIPILDEFVEKHPDFSYHGAKAVIALTGYEGAFGYSGVLEGNKQDMETVSNIANALRASNYELASHSFGHINVGWVSDYELGLDTQAWAENIGNLIGDTDIYIFPHGTDLTSDVGINSYNYLSTFQLLYDYGFRYFLNVDSSSASWMQFCDNYFRGARRDIDGYRLYYECESFSDLFSDVYSIYDDSRPPVEPIF